MPDMDAISAGLADVAGWLENEGRDKHARQIRAGITALAEAEARGRRQGLEEAAAYHDGYEARGQAAGTLTTARLHAKYATAIRSLATAPAETQKPETGESVAGWRLVPNEAPEAAKRAGTELALKVSLSSDYGWHQYMADLWRVMISATANEGSK